MPLNDKLAPAIRDARRELFSKIRNDWTYPDLQERTSTSNHHSTPSKQRPVSFNEADILEWRERTYASSDPSSDEDLDGDPAPQPSHTIPIHSVHHPAPSSSPNEPLSTISIIRSPTNPTSPTSPTSASTSRRTIKKPHLFARTLLKRSSSRSRSSDNSTGSPRASSEKVGVGSAASAGGSPLAAHFETVEGAEQNGVRGGGGDNDENPLGRDVQALRRERRKQKRMARFEEEMAWNEGLRYWAERRDAWTCARRVGDLDQSHGEVVNGVHEDGVHGEDTPAATDTETSTGLDSVSSSSSDETSLDTQPQEQQHSQHPMDPSSRSAKVLLPVAPPILPQTDPTRATYDAKTQTYTPPYALFPSMYSKVVIQSLTPSVPINLSTLIGALVDGWRRDGEWPPKSEVNGTNGVGHEDVKKRGRKGGDVEARLVKAGLMGVEERIGARDGRIKRGVEKVKRGLRIGGE